ncbi:3-hydroxyacyl-CoA dehydrogenase [Herbaspirillum sp. DW155]|uniref:3-hydroxyacyl-CoA dehydrogenase n=1 Tax=Herbaspirillum sp. DW155 TaxID=3095609 RepID=UPI003089F0A5|nr:3-hydroxyacyl-CoA dehydrogenase [Herbaspirillum sp. DW155]
MSELQNSYALPASAAVAVIGAGTMGAGIAQVAALAGHPVQLYDSREGGAAKAISDIRANLDKLANKDKIPSQLAQDACERLSVAGSLQDLHGARLVVEAIVEQLAAKQELFGKLEAIVDAQCILASNTSSISITHIGAPLRHPERLAGMHFFNPVPQMGLVEIIRGLASDTAVVQCLHDTARAWGKVPVVARSTPGFIVNRLARPYYAEALRVLHECGAQPATIDAVMREAGGFRMGPFELMDLIGHDVNFAVTQSVFHAYFNDPRFTPSLIQQELVHAGRLGRKSGYGFYRYGSGAETPQPATEPSFDPPTVPLQLFGTHPLVEVVRARYQGRVEYCPPRADNLLMKAGPARVYLTEGRTATQQSYDYNMPDVVLVDLALDYARATRLGITRADQCRDRAYQVAAGVLQACGFALSPMADVPGMVVMRTVCMLVNEAADAINQGVCSRADADLAMQKGVNYPRGPLAWADAIGIDTVASVLRQLGATYGEDRYRLSPLLQRLQASGRKFHE